MTRITDIRFDGNDPPMATVICTCRHVSTIPTHFAAAPCSKRSCPYVFDMDELYRDFILDAFRSPSLKFSFPKS